MIQSADRGRSALPYEVGKVEACLRSFPFRKELGRPSLLRSADVTSKAKGWSSVPVLWFGGEKLRCVQQGVLII
jgi:hypothetical protein